MIITTLKRFLTLLELLIRIFLFLVVTKYCFVYQRVKNLFFPSVALATVAL